jgi:hypothetical protein
MKLNICGPSYTSSTYRILYHDIWHDDWEVTHHTEPDGMGNYGTKTSDPIYVQNSTHNPWDIVSGWGEDQHIGDEIPFPYDTWENNPYPTSEPWNDIYTNNFSQTIFDYSQIQSDITNALSAWTSLCNSGCINNQYIQTCCPTISWTQNSQEFSNLGFDPTLTAAYSNYPSSNCQYDCNKMFIHINWSPDFTGAKDVNSGDFQKFYLTGSYEDNTNSWISLTAVLEHEFGHLFGFGDEYIGRGVVCQKSGSIMMNTNFNDPSRSLSDDDICMYMKLYCPGTLGVEENQITKEGFRLFPNPANDNSLTLQVNNPLGKQINFEIISPLGASILKDKLSPDEDTKNINLEDYPSGVYFIIFHSGDKQEMEKFVINK